MVPTSASLHLHLPLNPVLARLQEWWTASQKNAEVKSCRVSAPRTPSLRWRFEDWFTGWGIDIGFTGGIFLALRIWCSRRDARLCSCTGASGTSMTTRIAGIPRFRARTRTTGIQNWSAMPSATGKTGPALTRSGGRSLSSGNAKSSAVPILRIGSLNSWSPDKARICSCRGTILRDPGLPVAAARTGLEGRSARLRPGPVLTLKLLLYIRPRKKAGRLIATRSFDAMISGTPPGACISQAASAAFAEFTPGRSRNGIVMDTDASMQTPKAGPSNAELPACRSGRRSLRLQCGRGRSWMLQAVLKRADTGSIMDILGAGHGSAIQYPGTRKRRAVVPLLSAGLLACHPANGMGWRKQDEP